ncbi:hypothetical protein C8P68_11215 [Mucilaginibacter yixingensis]|uniref:Uncharacterized protein n=1 Tax=Mucilaginibacter yixingensis TaxID=1295612 RepID=A0A2T5J4I1_9SPHI|nr:hypothetical protein C8P68_11215 [Mucilaginibacter yixingensis]
MKLGMIVLFLLINSACTESTPVYICSSPHATRYHFRENCPGLSNCTYRKVKITLAEAKKQGKTLCHWEVDRP